jgi:predicted  nucleic acid-binding Zn-ribbon protein
VAVYICKCLFCFERTGDISACPDCGSASIRYATDEETAEYRRNKEQEAEPDYERPQERTESAV